MGHVDHDLPVQFHEAIRRLVARCRSDNVGGIVDKMFSNLCPKKFGVTIAPETPSIGTGIHAKETESHKN